MFDNVEEEHGWTAVSRSLSKLVASRIDPKPPQPMTVDQIDIPDTPLVQEVMKNAKENLPPETFNHSMRVYYFGRAITLQHFPTWTYSPTTLLLTALLHDLGTTSHNQSQTHLSFEFHGALLSLSLLESLHTPTAQAESVAEAIIRHQDLGETGNVTTLTAVVHFATVLDNAGLWAEELVHMETVKSVVAAFPRNGWTSCFADVVREECRRKPWANTTRIEGFAEMVEGNAVMRDFD